MSRVQTAALNHLCVWQQVTAGIDAGDEHCTVSGLARLIFDPSDHRPTRAHVESTRRACTGLAAEGLVELSRGALGVRLTGSCGLGADWQAHFGR